MRNGFPDGRMPGNDGRADWIRQRDDTPRGVRRLVTVFREKILLILSVVAVAIAAGVVLWATGAERYQAEALILVSPIAADDSLYAGTTVLREASAPTRDVETISRIIETVPVAAEAQRLLQTDRTPEDLLGSISASPVAQSYLVSIEAEGAFAEEAADVANAFGRATVAVRSRQLAEQLATIRSNLRKQVDAGTASPESRQRLADLEAVGDADPTVRIESPATAPEEAVSPGLALVLTASIVVGLACGCGAALLADASNIRIRNEDQALDLLDLPVVARVPLPARRGPESREHASPARIEGLRTLQQNIALLRRGDAGARSVLFASVDDGDGRTATVVGTALGLGEAGRSVIVIDADFRRPSVHRSAIAAPAHGVGDVVSGACELDDALVPLDSDGRVMALVQGADRLARTTPLKRDEARRLIAAAGELGAEFVIFDAPPLGEVADALPIATAVDDVLLMILAGRTRAPDLSRASDALATQGVRPRGIVLATGRPAPPAPPRGTKQRADEAVAERT